MSGVELTPLTVMPRIRTLAAAASHSAALEARVDELWREAARTRGPGLTDRPIFSVVAETGDEFTGCFVPYRYYLAQRMDPKLRPELRVRPLAVTGIVRCADGLIIGLRAANSTQDPGSWDFLPAGGVDAGCLRPDGFVDAEQQLRRELQEELGLGLDAAVRPKPLWRMSEGEVIDLVFGIEIALGAHKVAASFAALSAPEHSAIEVLNPATLLRTPADERRFSPSCRALLVALVRERQDFAIAGS